MQKEKKVHYTRIFPLKYNLQTAGAKGWTGTGASITAASDIQNMHKHRLMNLKTDRQKETHTDTDTQIDAKMCHQILSRIYPFFSPTIPSTAAWLEETWTVQQSYRHIQKTVSIVVECMKNNFFPRYYCSINFSIR